MKGRTSKRLIGMALLALIAASAMAQDRVSKIRERLLNRDMSTVIVAAHRGDWRNFPENSLEALESAILLAFMAAMTCRKKQSFSL